MTMATPEQTAYGGHDREFIGEVPDRLVCTICTKVLRDPHLTGCCGQHFCESCLTHWFERHKTKTCPYCREENLAHMLNMQLKRDINQLKVYCTHHDEGCKWEGEMGDLQTHLDSNKGCGYVEVECPNMCKSEILTVNTHSHRPALGLVLTRVKRKNVEDHLNTKCYLRRYKCIHCDLEDTYCAITGKGRPNMLTQPHYQVCPMLPLVCPNMCGAKGIKRKDMLSHQEQCPLEELECPNKCKIALTSSSLPFYGECMIKRKDLPEHLSAKCYLRRYSCKYCGHEDTYKAITGMGGPLPIANFHYTSCPEYPLACPNTCGVKQIKRKDMPSHREQCRLELLQCPFQEAGCYTGVVRCDFENHMATQMQRHLMLTFQTVRELRKQNNELQLKCATLEKELKTVKAALQ